VRKREFGWVKYEQAGSIGRVVKGSMLQKATKSVVRIRDRDVLMKKSSAWKLLILSFLVCDLHNTHYQTL